MRRTLKPTEMERSYARWVADRGDETLRLDYPLGPDSIVLDAGGYEGDWSARMIERYRCRVHVFEPVPEYVTSIEARLAPTGRAFVHAVGLAGADGEAEFFLSGDGSSALRREGARSRVRMREAAAMFAELGIRDLDLIKINIEGGEYALLEHLLDREWMPRIAHVQVQFHDFVPGAKPRMDAILARLARTHEPQWRYPFIWESWRRRNA